MRFASLLDSEKSSAAVHLLAHGLSCHFSCSFLDETEGGVMVTRGQVD
jgi:hypothetical protein